MTIYILSEDPKETAQFLDDKSLDKMIRDISQVLCNVHYYIGSLKLKPGTISLKNIKDEFNIPLNHKFIQRRLWVIWARS